MCNISLSSLEYLTKHNSRFHGITNEKANIISDGDNDGERNVYFCSASDVACKQKFMTSRSYIAHMKQVSQVILFIKKKLISYDKTIDRRKNSQ